MPRRDRVELIVQAQHRLSGYLTELQHQNGFSDAEMALIVSEAASKAAAEVGGTDLTRERYPRTADAGRVPRRR